MDADGLLDVVVAAAHEVWRQRLLRAGWLPGGAYDLEQRTHPGLVPYDCLPAYRKGQLRRFLMSECDAESLVDAVDIVLGEPEWTADDLHRGLRVRMADDLHPGTVGTVVSWELADEASGALSSISVRWPDGEVVEYTPAMHELVRADGS